MLSAVICLVWLGQSAKPVSLPSPKALKLMTADKLADALFAVAIDRLESAGGDRKALLKLPGGLRMVYTVETLDSEVNNGGFDQYFYNCDQSGCYQADLALQDLLLIGDDSRSALVGQAIQLHKTHSSDPQTPLVPGHPVSDKEVGWGVTYRKIDDAYYKIKTNLRKAEAKYIRSHPESLSG